MSADHPLARAASGFIGVPFRLRGRDPRRGLDCLGLVAASLEALGRPVPVLGLYTLRQREIGGLLALARRSGLRPADGAVRPGDVLLFDLQAAQFHAGIQDGGGAIIHAHAGLRRVVRGPAPAEARIVRRWRLN